MISFVAVLYPLFVAVAVTVNVPAALNVILFAVCESTAAPVSPALVTAYVTFVVGEVVESRVIKPLSPTRSADTDPSGFVKALPIAVPSSSLTVVLNDAK